MIRSYVVTTAFVTFRVVFEVFKQAGVGTVPERLAATAWLCWSIPLLLAEVVLQGRKMTSTSEIQPRQQRRVPSI
jgi:type III secretory pathway component EscR